VSYPWFRMYHRVRGDPVIQALAFEDQRHFVMALCLKPVDSWMGDASAEFRHRAICKALGLDPVAGTDASAGAGGRPRVTCGIRSLGASAVQIRQLHRPCQKFRARNLRRREEIILLRQYRGKRYT